MLDTEVYICLKQEYFGNHQIKVQMTRKIQHKSIVNLTNEEKSINL